MRYRIKSPPVVAETLDGEATIVDLESGTYYALNDSGTFIWDELARGEAVAGIADGLAARYGIESDAAQMAVGDLTARLLERQLIVESDGQPAPAQQPTNGSSPPSRHNGDYREPELNAFTDMQELLLLDPVHEVDDAGWPNPG